MTDRPEPADTAEGFVHSIAVVIPVYRGEATLPPLLEELSVCFTTQTTPGGHRWRIDEVVLVHDCGPDGSAGVIRALADAEPRITPVWLARNFGQHPATLAGISSTAAPWVCTMDEDGQHVPADIALLLDAALRERCGLVYGHHQDSAPHARWRNTSSRTAKWIARSISGVDASAFTSFRLMSGPHARSIAAYCGPRTYLDIALTWAIDRHTVAEVSTRPEWRADSGYDLHKLISHFWTLVLSSGTRPLRAISISGCIAAVAGFLGAIIIAIRALLSEYSVAGWASVMTTLLVTGGLILLAIGVVAEYIAVLLRVAQGRPLYIVLDDPSDLPMNR
ncbi:MAG: glycosyltransferase [Ilumatobacteraceae bacterium]